MDFRGKLSFVFGFHSVFLFSERGNVKNERNQRKWESWRKSGLVSRGCHGSSVWSQPQVAEGGFGFGAGIFVPALRGALWSGLRKGWCSPELSQSRMEPISSKNGKEVQWDGEVRCLFLVNDISDKSLEEGEPSEVRADPVQPAESSRGHNQERACQEGGARAGRDKSGIPAFPSSAKGDSSGWEGPQGSSDSLLRCPSR